MSIEHAKPAKASNSKEATDDENELILAKSISVEKRSYSPPVPARTATATAEDNQQSGIGYFFSYIT